MTDAKFAAIVGDALLDHVSDYLSFVGSDARGRVCLALDSNRGYDADPRKVKGRPAAHLQAEHAYAVLHDEQCRRSFAGLSGLKVLYLRAGDGPQPGDLSLQQTPWAHTLAGLGPQIGLASGPAAPGTADTGLSGLTRAHRRWGVPLAHQVDRRLDRRGQRAALTGKGHDALAAAAPGHLA